MSKKILSIVLILFIASGFSLYAKAPDGWNANKQMTDILNKMTDYTEVKRTIVNVGNWLYWVANDGVMGYNAATQQSGGMYPKGKGAVVYTEGLVYGGYVDENDNGQMDPDTDRLAVGGTTYGTGLQCGWIEDGSAVPLNKIWRIRADWETLTPQDVEYEAEQLGVSPEEVIAQYEHDWNNWPAEHGAPYYDNNDNGQWDPDVDEPGVANADQVLWFAANDLNKGLVNSLYGSQPIGLEIQGTMWAYAQPTTKLGQIVFKKYTVINKSGKDVLDAYVSQFVDPDVGNYGNDFVGCDTSLSLGYSYNGTPTDPAFPDIAPPAVGFDFFQGPIVEAAGQTANWNFGKREGYKNLPMTTFGWFAAGSPITDPTMGGDYEGTKQWYNLLKGYKPYDDLAEPDPWTVGNVSGGQETNFPLCGDPVNDPASNRIDGQGNYFQSGDRRMSLASGPFTLAAADTQEIVLAVIGGSGATRLASIIQVKQTDEMAQLVYNNAFKEIPSPPDRPDASYITDEDAVVLEWGSNHDAVQATETKVKSGYEFEGYNVYQFPSSMASLDDATKIATYDVVNNITKIMGTEYIAEYGGVSQIPVQNGTNTGIKRHIKITKDHISGYRLYEGRTYYFGVTAYNYNPDADQIKQLESAPVILDVRVEEPDPGTKVSNDYGSEFTTEHVTGSAGGDITYKIIDPMKTTGHSYEVYFNKQHYYLDDNGKWKTTNYPDSVGKLAKTSDLTGSYLSAASVWGDKDGTIDLKFWANVIAPDYDYCDGIEITLPSSVTINSASSIIDVPVSIDDASNTVMFGSNDTTTAGPFAGGELITINVSEFTPPLTAEYTMYDDGWAVDYGDPYAGLGDGVVHVDSSVTINEVGNVFRTVEHWNLYDATANENVLEDQTIVNGTNLERVVDGEYYSGGENVGVDATPIVDGFQPNLNILYAAPSDWASYTHIAPDGTEDDFSQSRADAWLNYDQHGKPYILTSYGMQGWAASSRAIDAYGSGTTLTNDLQRDYELRFTGEYGDPITDGDLTYHPIKEGTGSKAVIYGSRNYDFTLHPDPNNPGTGDPFFIQIPFEVWDMEAEGGPRQVSILIYDRMQDVSAGGDFYAFNLSDRMYTFFLLEPYEEVTDPAAATSSDMLTWNVVWWNCDWTNGDVVHFVYDNPVQFGTDKWSFKTEKSITDSVGLMKEEVAKINVFPNPYYANNGNATDRFQEYVTFTHLPQKAEIRIFNLKGVLVEYLKKDNNNQHMKWDLTNTSDLPVGSGIYIANIKLPDLGMSKNLKIAVIQKKQILKYF